MISAVSWIPKGVLKSVPVEAEIPSKEELEEIWKVGDDENKDYEEDTSNQDDEVAHALAVADALRRGSVGAGNDTDSSMADALKDLNMDNYDEEDDGIELFGPGLKNVYYPSNDMDPYLKNQGYDSEELEDITIKPEDMVVICARNEDDFSHLEVWIIEESEESGSNIYVHHDIVIPAFPLCMSWLDSPVKGGEKGNFIAVGSMDPAIEIWDLDVMDEVQPSAILGGIIEKNKKKGKKKTIKYKEGSHTDAVLGLAWNMVQRQLLASASADKLVKIWDVTTEKCCITMDHHTDKVQAVAWDPFDRHILLTGSFDDSVVMKDARWPSYIAMKWQLTADIESLAWDPHSVGSFVVSVEDGMVSSFRVTDCKPSFSLHAHDQAVCSVAYNPKIPNLLATGSKDKLVKLWDLSNDQPSFITSKNPKAGAVFSLSFSNDSPFLLAVGGSKGKLELWDLRTDDAICARYPEYIKKHESTGL